MESVQVIIGISAKSLDRPFTYSVPKHLIGQVDVGAVVLVPFGKGNTLKEAYVVQRGYMTKTPEYVLKEIHEVVQSAYVERDLIRLAYWLHKRYACNIIDGLKLMIPSDLHLKVKEEKVVTQSKEQYLKMQQGIKGAFGKALTPRRKEVLEAIDKVYGDVMTKAPIRLKDLAQQTQATTELLKKIGELDYFSIDICEVGRVIEELHHQQGGEQHQLHDEQQCCIDRVSQTFGFQKTFLLHGVTGSGKTEVYMQLIQKVLDRGESVIVLIPEIGLTPLTTQRFVQRFGQIVGVLHSKLNPGERYEQWTKAKRGEIRIMVGARSAIFTPFQNIGLIIIDEEHEQSYKSEMSPRYHAREVSIKRSMDHQCPVVLGSATPSIESYYKAVTEQYQLLSLQNRAVQGSNRYVTMVDMRHELEKGNKSILSDALEKAIYKALQQQEQIILFINRRGFANFVSCRKCGYVYECDHCDVSMTYHASNRRMICHYCGASKPLSENCPECNSTYLKAFGAGTQKIHAYIKKQFPNARVARMDQDTTRKKHGHTLILKAFEKKEIDILIGTQMITKGHDFHNVSVVGVLAADLSLHIDDFRAAERTFQLVTQVIGRTGRGEIEGHGFIQTYSPDHYALMHALKEDYVGFYNEEIVFRRAMIYPPFCHILQIIVLSESESVGMNYLKQCVEKIECQDAIEKQEGNILILGPAKASIGKVKGQYRHRLLVKGNSYRQLTLIRKKISIYMEQVDKDSLQIQMDINPMMMY